MNRAPLLLSLIFGFGICLPAFSQTLAVRHAAPPFPEKPAASDGVYEKFVLIRWDAVESASSYKVFRSPDPARANLQEVSAGWQNSTWLCDYTALAGVDYYYAVAASNDKGVSKLSAFDKGFVKKKLPVAEENRTLSSNELYAEPKRYFLLLSNFSADKAEYAPGSPVSLSYKLENVFDRPAPRTELRYFLSTDAQLDWEDLQLTSGPKVYSGFPPESAYQVDFTVQLPSGISAGKYYIIIASSSEKDMLNSKLATLEINVAQ